MEKHEKDGKMCALSMWRSALCALRKEALRLLQAGHGVHAEAQVELALRQEVGGM